MIFSILCSKQQDSRRFYLRDGGTKAWQMSGIRLTINQLGNKSNVTLVDGFRVITKL